MSTNRECIFSEIDKERENQDKKWGGNAHDDEHEPFDFSAFIHKHNSRIQVTNTDYDISRKHLLRVAALAVAGIESIDRKTY